MYHYLFIHLMGLHDLAGAYFDLPRFLDDPSMENDANCHCRYGRVEPMIDLMNGFINLFDLEALFFVILAAFVGIVAGALPA